MRDLKAEACANLWAAVIAEHIKQAEKGSEESKIFLSRDGLAVAAMMGIDVRTYWSGVRDLALS